MSRFTALDLSQLPPPQLIDELDYESVLQASKDYVLSVWTALRLLRPTLPEFDTLDLETEPVAIVLQALAYRETVLRGLVNDKARAPMLALSFGADIDHLGARFETPRMTDEPDDRYRRRVQLAPEAFSVAGPPGAYEFWALTLSTDIADAHAFSPDPSGPADGRVTVVVAGADGEPISDVLIAALVDRYEQDDLVPLTDVWSVVRATTVPVNVTAQLIVPRGPDPALIKTAAEIAIRAYMAQRYRIGAEVYRVGLTAAAKVGGVDNVILAAPVADVVCGDMQIPVIGSLTVTTLVD